MASWRSWRPLWLEPEPDGDGPCRPGGKQRELRLGLVPVAVVFGALAVLARPGEGPQTSLCHGHRAQGGFRSGSLRPSVEFRVYPCFFSK